MHKNIFEMKLYVQWTCYTTKIKQVNKLWYVNLARGNNLCVFLTITRQQAMRLNLILFHQKLKQHDQEQLVWFG